jgi:hypothetical protein
MRRLWLIAASCVALASCAGTDPGRNRDEIRLSVHERLAHDAQRDATLLCDRGKANGTGYLAERRAAESACEAVGVVANRTRLIDGPDRRRICLQEYGGPQRATVTGRIDKSSVDSTIARGNSCEINDWNRLIALLGPPE